MSLNTLWEDNREGENREKRKFNKWSDSETNYLIEHYATNSIADMARSLGRSYGSVAAKSHKLRLNDIDIGRAGSKRASRFSGREWTGHEVDMIINEYSKIGAVELSKVIGRSDSAIRHMVKKLRRSGRDIGVPNRWSEAEDNFIVDNYEHMTMKEMSIYLDRSFNSVQSRIYRMGISK